MILLYHILQCVYWDAAAVYLWFANHGCVFVWYPKPKDLWGLMYMQINRDSSNCSAVLCVFSNPCVPSSNRKSPLQRHSMISKWICISEMCIYVYLCKFIYLYMRINRWLCVRVFGLNQNEYEIKQFYELLSMEMMCFSWFFVGWFFFFWRLCLTTLDHLPPCHHNHSIHLCNTNPSTCPPSSVKLLWGLPLFLLPVSSIFNILHPICPLLHTSEPSQPRLSLSPNTSTWVVPLV